MTSFTLTLLGTDTKYTPGFAEGSYPRGETLSYISSLISHSSASRQEGPVSLKTDTVTVIDGPRTQGSEVGDRIARGLLEVLNALARSQTDINIIAHSRGAVESIILSHYLNQIKESIANDPNFTFAQIADFDICPYTKTVLQEAFKNDLARFDDTDQSLLRTKVPAINLGMFLLDPVPGEDWLGVTRAVGLGWYNPKFYEIPPIVKEFHECLYLYEHTRCFKPVVPRPVSELTQVHLMTLPGHHGTGSGNPHDQQKRESPTGVLTTEVQDILLIKILDFLMKRGVSIYQVALDQDRGELNAIVRYCLNDDFSVSPKKRDEHILSAYQDMLSKLPEYHRYNQTTYRALGRERSWELAARHNVRTVRVADGVDAPISEVVPDGRSPGEKYFINEEHVILFMRKELGLIGQQSIAAMIKTVSDRLMRIYSQIEDQAAMCAELEDDWIVTSAQSQLVDLALSSSAPGTKTFNPRIMQLIQGLIQEATHIFMTHSLDSQELRPLSDAVFDAFKNFRDFAGHHENSNFTIEILPKLEATLISSIESKKLQIEELIKYCDAPESEDELISLFYNSYQEVIFFVDLVDSLKDLCPKLGDQEDYIASCYGNLIVKVNRFVECVFKHREEYTQWLVAFEDNPEFQEIVKEKYEYVMAMNQLWVLTLEYFIDISCKRQRKHLSDDSEDPLNIKFKIVRELINILKSQDINAEEIIRNFNDALVQNQPILSAHRDPAWKRFLNGVCIALAVIATGVIPGLIILSLREKSLFHSSGHSFFEKCSKVKIPEQAPRDTGVLPREALAQ